MLISGRQAASQLAADAGVTTRHARRLLAAGLAGQPIRTTGSTLYDARRVAALAGWPRLDDATLDRACPDGLFIARRDVDLGASRADQLAAVGARWPLPRWTRAWIWTRLDLKGHLPLVASISGFVVLGAEITGAQSEPDAKPNELSYRLDLREPGQWFERLEGRRLDLEPGGGAWMVRGWSLGANRVAVHAPRPYA